MATTNLTQSGTHTEVSRESLCSPLWLGDFKQQSISFSAVNILLSITAILGNTLILIALHKESSLHPPYKLFVSLSGNNWSVGWSCYPSSLYPTVVYEHWSFFRPLLLHHNYTIWSGNLSRLVPKDFPCFRSSQVQIQDHVQQQPSQPNALKMVRYRRAVFNALRVQLALVICYVPQITVRILIYLSAKRFWIFFLIIWNGNCLNVL